MAGGVGGATVTSGERPEMLLNILQRTEHLSTTKNYLAPDVNSTEVKNANLGVGRTRSQQGPEE